MLIRRLLPQGRVEISAMKKILVLANDAGGAAILSSLVRAERSGYDWTVIAPAGSPASRIFRDEDVQGRLLICEAGKLSPDFLASLGAGLILFNPGWNQFPRDAIAGMNAAGARKVAVLDHWMDNRERFGFPAEGWRRNLPDFIAVTDSRAYQLAKAEGLPCLLKLKNYLVHDQLQRFAEIDRERRGKPDALLFLSQTVAATQNVDSGGFTYIGENEEQVARSLFERFDALAVRFGVTRLKIRLHPAESQFRFAALAHENPQVPFEVELAHDRELLESIAGARLVVGMNSMALYTAYICGRPAVSVIPGPGIRCTLPLPAEFCLTGLNGIFDIDFRNGRAFQTTVDFFDDYDFAHLVRVVSGSMH